MSRDLPISDEDHDPTHQILIENIEKKNRKAKIKAKKRQRESETKQG